MDLSMQPSGSCNSMPPSPRNFLPNAGNHLHKPTFDANEVPYEPMAVDDQRTTDDSSAFFNDIPDQLPSNKTNSSATATNLYYRDSNVANDLPNYLTNRNEVMLYHLQMGKHLDKSIIAVFILIFFSRNSKGNQ